MSIDAWAVAAAIIYLNENIEIHYEELNSEILRTNLSGLGKLKNE